MQSAPFTFEQELWNSGYSHIAGLDEVGKGCFAGPVVVGCVVFPQNITAPENIRIDDSKKLSSSQREKAAIWIKENCLAWAIGHTSAKVVNEKGITKATEISYIKSLDSITKSKLVYKSISHVDFLLLDAFPINTITLPQKAIIKGDTKSFSIAAASIIAKVYRDSFMERLSKKDSYSPYAWDKNKGYGSLHHRKKILEIGITNQHRTQYVQTFLRKSGVSFDFASFPRKFDV